MASHSVHAAQGTLGAVKWFHKRSALLREATGIMTRYEIYLQDQIRYSVDKYEMRRWVGGLGKGGKEEGGKGEGKDRWRE